jgi:adenylyltransferase/sulfurtransferase
VGVLGPAVAAIAAMQAAEALKILAGRLDQVSPYLLKIDLWQNTLQRIDAAQAAPSADCPCCRGGFFDFLEA